MVPFSQKSGVLEWCSETMPISLFLVDPKQGAHRRFRPQDWTSMECRVKMMVRLRVGLALGDAAAVPSWLLWLAAECRWL